jgi:two-component system, chemotaxis family, protein-glutamate methylesterase/glutaminase
MSDGGNKEIRVLVVDDSPTVCDVVYDMLTTDPDIRVIGTANDGRDAIEKVRLLHPDLVTMDIEMPRMDGFEAIEQIMAFNPVPIVVLTSSMWGRGKSYAYKALELGAVAVFPKPRDLNDLNRRFVAEVKMLSQATVITHIRGKRKPRMALDLAGSSSLADGHRAVGIVCSTGGPNALRRILAALPADLPAGVVVVQHISEGFDSELTSWLADKCTLNIRRAVEGDLILPGVVYICPAGRHTVIQDGGKIALNDSPPIDCFRPSGDLMLSSMSRIYGQGALGVILTGMGRDGAQGIKAIKEAGGRTIAQDEGTSLIFGMPRAAIELGVVDKVAPLEAIAREILEGLCSSWV